MSEASHGNTPAAWTAVVLGLVGFVVGGVGLMFSPIDMTLFWIGVAIALVALVAYFALDKVLGRSSH